MNLSPTTILLQSITAKIELTLHIHTAHTRVLRAYRQTHWGSYPVYIGRKQYKDGRSNLCAAEGLEHYSSPAEWLPSLKVKVEIMRL